MKRVLVCGGRDFGVLLSSYDDTLRRVAFAERKLLWDTLTQLWKDPGISTIIHGGARGADTFAGEWAEGLVPTLVFPAEWKRFGPMAGRIRNERMLAEGKPDLVVACEGGKGTEHMVRIARRAELPITTVRLPHPRFG